MFIFKKKDSYTFTFLTHITIKYLVSIELSVIPLLYTHTIKGGPIIRVSYAQ